MKRQNCNWVLAEIGFLIATALPTTIECFTQGLQMKLSNIFIGRASGSNVASMLSALFIGQTFIGLIISPISEGIGSYVNVLCSQAYGAKQYRLVGLYYYRALFMSFLTCAPVFTVFIGVRPIVYLLFKDRELAEYSGSYTDILCFGYPAYLYFKIGIRFLQALNIVWIPTVYLLIGITLNGIIQYTLIFVYNTGIKGAAAGYVISNYLVALLIFTHIQLSHVHTMISHEWSVEFISDWYHSTRYAAVSVVQWMTSSIPKSILPVVLIGVIERDQRQLAIYSILYSIWWICAMGSMGFANAITVRVGYLLGANQPNLARKVTILDIVFAQFTMVLCSIIVLSASRPLAHLFTTDASFAEDLTWNIRLLSFLINSDVKMVVQGAMNACCMQVIQTTLKFVFQLIIGSVAAVILVHFVEWKAFSILLQFSVTGIICTVIGSILLLCSDWKKIANYITTNTDDKTMNYVESDNLTTRSILNSKSFLLFRYIACFVISIFVFVITLCLIRYH